MSATPVLLEVLLTVIIKETDDVYDRIILPAVTTYFKKLVNSFFAYTSKNPKSRAFYKWPWKLLKSRNGSIPRIKEVRPFVKSCGFQGWVTF